MSNKRRRKRIPGRKRKKALSKIWIISVIAAAILIAVIAIAAACNTKNKSSSSEENSYADGQEDQGLTFPYELEDGRLSIDSIFQFTGFNPDNGERGG